MPLQQWLKTALLILGCAVLASLTFLIVKTYQFECATVQSVNTTLGKIQQTSTEANRVLLETGLTMKNLREASGAWKKSSEDQAAATTLVVQTLNTDLVKVGALIDHTDATINAQVGPQTMAVLRAFGGTVESLDADARALKPALDNAAVATANAATLTADPAIADTLHHLDATSANVAQTTAHVEGTAADIQLYVRRLTSPARSAWGIVKTLLGLGSELRILIK